MSSQVRLKINKPWLQIMASLKKNLPKTKGFFHGINFHIPKTHYNFALCFNSTIDTIDPQIQSQTNNLRFWKFIEFLGGFFLGAA